MAAKIHKFFCPPQPRLHVKRLWLSKRPGAGGVINGGIPGSRQYISQSSYAVCPQHGRVRTPFFPGTGGVPPLFREREPPSVPTSAKRGFAKNFRVPGKKGERPESGFGSGNDQTPYAPEMPVPPSRSHFRSGFTSTPVLFPLLVPTSVPGFARCCLFRVPFPQRENPEVESTPRGVSEKATFLSTGGIRSQPGGPLIPPGGVGHISTKTVF